MSIISEIHLYNHVAHNEYEEKINNSDNIKSVLYNTLKTYKKYLNDNTIYSDDQESQMEQLFPHRSRRGVPFPSINDFNSCINNYKYKNYLYSVKYYNPQEHFCDILFLDLNDNGKVWLFVFDTEKEIVDDIEDFLRIDLNTNTVIGLHL